MDEFTLSDWRLLRTPPASGAWNMAVDEAILEAVYNRSCLPTLRLYAWDPPCLSLGYAQPIADVDRSNLQLLGWHLVRRPTGGRAILHTDELTYSVMAPPDEPRLAGGVLESYSRLAQAILLALQRLGLPAQASLKYDTPASSKMPNPVCFEVPSNYEITVGGKKLVGSAQARRRDGILQHGALPLQGDLTRIVSGLTFPDELNRQNAARRLLERATTAESILGAPPTWEQAAQAFADCFAETLNLRWSPAELSASETARAQELVEAKYAHLSWTERH